MPREIIVPAQYYSQFDADVTLPDPGKSYGGWKKQALPLNPDKTAFVIMHAWDTGTPEQYPGWYRAVEYLPRAQRILEDSFVPFVDRVRKSGMRLFHVAAPNQVLEKYPGYQFARALPGAAEVSVGYAEEDETLRVLRTFRAETVFPGGHNIPDIRSGQHELDFHPVVRPQGEEPVACTSAQLFALCRHFGINHLIYTGFAVNACLTISPGGFVDMSRHSVLCSIIPDLTTAVENAESCTEQRHKAYGLWYFSIMGGFVYDLSDLYQTLI